MSPRRNASLFILWDVDGTLLDTDWTDKRAMAEAGREVIGREFILDGVDMAGTLDPNIWREIAAANGIADADGLEGRYRAAYLARLKAREAEQSIIRALPGARELTTRLGETPAAVQGVLSGNYPEIGLCKLACAGIDSGLFSVYAWGSDGQSRRDLFPVAFTRFQAQTGHRVDPERTVVIGDTPRDIACAHEFDCRLLAVASGKFNTEQLTAAGAETVFVNLADTKAILDWIRA